MNNKCGGNVRFYINHYSLGRSPISLFIIHFVPTCIILTADIDAYPLRGASAEKRVTV
jgi:hypothetical protein